MYAASLRNVKTSHRGYLDVLMEIGKHVRSTHWCASTSRKRMTSSWTSQSSRQATQAKQSWKSGLGTSWEEAVLGQQSNKTNNRCESSHLTTFKCVQYLEYSSPITGRLHSATHSVTFGEMRFMLKLNALLGTKNVFLQWRQPLKKVEEWHMALLSSFQWVNVRLCFNLIWWFKIWSDLNQSYIKQGKSRYTTYDAARCQGCWRKN